jgi:DNA-binding transcriptional MerR regulator
MPLSRARDYLSIGEVLEALQADFPDVTISKIRFLEAEGLIAPERTEAGYRKFYERDVERLRYILSLQRDHFMPLKVIRERLEQAEGNGGIVAPPPPAPQEAEPAVDRTGVQLSRDELMRAARLSPDQLRGLEEFGLLEARDGLFDETDLALARAAKRFFDYGVEPRHLRMYRQFAEREAAFFAQIVSPVARRHDPDSARRAATSVRELINLARQVREATLRASVRELI